MSMIHRTDLGTFVVSYVSGTYPRPGHWAATDRSGVVVAEATRQDTLLLAVGVTLPTLWSAAEMAEILNDVETIMSDPALTVRSDGGPVRPLGYWEEMRLDQAEMIRSGNIYKLP